ncbi:MAG: TetR/AcrR family transcriptional regulator [Nocardioides sp.]|uniref:TetR/AcrR family transcriptional regulator n=1 Tax=Nocardioides sp. TaxID=35761 RepID=UPI0039E33BC4
MSTASMPPEPVRRRGRPRSATVHRAIIEAAVRLAVEHGVERLTVDAIAQAAGVSRTTVYKWWHSPAAVLLEGMLERESASLEYASDADPRSAMAEHLLALRRIADSDTGELVRQVLAASVRDERTGTELRRRWLMPRRAVALELIERGIRAGELPDDIDPSAILDLVVAPIYHRLMFRLPSLSQREVLDQLRLVWPERPDGPPAAGPDGAAARREAGRTPVDGAHEAGA